MQRVVGHSLQAGVKQTDGDGDIKFENLEKKIPLLVVG